MKFFLLAFPALLSIINPLGGAFLFLSATRGLSFETRAILARRVAFYSFCLLFASLYMGAYVLNFFGISLPVLRVAGGIVIALTGWRLLNAPDQAEETAGTPAAPRPQDASRIAFYPLTMPLTTGPGTIAVAIALGTGRPMAADRSMEEAVLFFVWALATVVIICASIFAAYRYADRLSHMIGPNGTSIILRLTAFLLFCIGIQVFWTGAAELLTGVGAH